MSTRILHLRLTEVDMAAVRAHTRAAAQAVGLEGLQQTRMATAVSEIARNAIDHGKDGVLEFLVDASSVDARPCLVVEIRDAGPGIADVPSALRGAPLAAGRVGMGIPGSGRLVDRMHLESSAGTGTRVRLEMDLPRGAPAFSAADLAGLGAKLRSLRPLSPLQELQEQNRELLRLHQELREKQSALELADERKNQFVKTLAHELRNPLSTLEMSLQLLRRKPDLSAEQVHQRYDAMGRQTAQLTRLVEELMDAARVSQGKLELSTQPSELNELITHAVEMTGAAVAAKSHAVTLHLNDRPLWVQADRPRLTQVLCNLIQNSARYTPREGAILIEVARSADTAVVRVTDNGKGISSELLPHVFELFVQGDARASDTQGGLGLGLTLVQHLVAGHGGQVSVASEGVDRGSTFTVRLPLIAEPAA